MSMLNRAIRLASILRSLALRCSLTPIATPVTVGIAVIARRPMTIFASMADVNMYVQTVEGIPKYGRLI